MKILIADDSRTERLILSAQLRKWGYEFVLASSGEEALKIMLSPGHPKLAILDWVMPGLTGPEVVQYIRKKMKDDYVYCILVTSLGSKEDIIEGLRSGADDYIPKPVHSGELKVRLRAAERLLEAWSAIADSEKKTRSILDSAGDAVILISPEGLINYANPQAEALLCQVGTSPLGTSFYDYLASPEEQHEAQQKLQQLINDGGSPGSGGRFELNLRGADGHMSTVSLGAAPLRNAQTQAISIFMTDISEQRRLEQQLDQITVPEFAGLQARILNQQLPPRNDPLLDKLLDWLIPAGGFTIQLWRPAMVACLPLVFGIVLGNYYSFGVGLQSSEVEYWEDELAMLSLSDYSESIF